MTKQQKIFGSQKSDELRIAKLKIQNSEAELIRIIVEHSGVSNDIIEQIFKHIRKNFENLYQYKEKNIELGIRHIYTLFNNVR